MCSTKYEGKLGGMPLVGSPSAPSSVALLSVFNSLFKPSHLHGQTRGYISVQRCQMAAVIMTRTRTSTHTLLYSTLQTTVFYSKYIGLTCIVHNYFPCVVWGWGAGEHRQTEGRKEGANSDLRGSEKEAETTQANCGYSVAVQRALYKVPFCTLLHVIQNTFYTRSAEAEKRRACLCRLLEGPAIFPGARGTMQGTTQSNSETQDSIACFDEQRRFGWSRELGEFG